MPDEAVRALPDEVLFALLRHAADEAGLDVSDEEIIEGHHRTQWYAWIAREAFAAGRASVLDAMTDEWAASDHPGDLPEHYYTHHDLNHIREYAAPKPGLPPCAIFQRKVTEWQAVPGAEPS